MLKILGRLLGVALMSIAPVVTATPCVPGTLQDYIDLDPTVGCEIGVTRFSEFLVAPGAGFATPIDPSLVQVTPNNSATHPALLFTLNASATGTDVFESFFRFLVTATSPAPFVGASLSMIGGAATGNGAASIAEDLCLGGLFLPLVPAGCSTVADAMITLAIDGFSITGDSRTFPAVGSIDVFADFTVDGGITGTAALAGGTLAFALIPEPPAALLILLALATLTVHVRRRRQRH